jgi:hypothetical protein
MCIYIYVFLFPLLYYNYSFVYLYKGYASYIHIPRGYVKHERLRTTGLEERGKATRNFSRRYRCPGRDCNQLPAEQTGQKLYHLGQIAP